jgi:hypothetical protein
MARQRRSRGFGRGRAFGLALLLALLAPSARAADPHALFEARCGRCHGHAGAFARGRLEVEGGELVARGSGRPVAAFLAGHMGGLDPTGVKALVEGLERQLRWDGVYQRRCRVCHDEASRLARRELVLGDDGRLLGRYSGLDTEAFLRWHGRLLPDEVPVIVEMLRWQLEVATPEE